MWTWLGNELQGKPAGGINGYLNPAEHDGRPPRFHFVEALEGNFEYLPALVACYYRTADLDAFEPLDRYLTFDRVVTRFKRFCSEAEATTLIRMRAQTGELESFHPRTGGTAGTRRWGQEEGFPPLEQGLFLLDQVQAVEADCGQISPFTAALVTEGNFVPLNRLLEDCWDLPMAELPKERREAIRKAFSPHAWDALDADQRRALADQLDSQRDPALEEDRARIWDEITVDWKYWRDLPTLSAVEFTALRHVRDPRKLDSEREVFPGGERPSLGQRIDDDLRRIHADPAVADERLSLRKWVAWAEKKGLTCPTFMHAQLAADATTAASRAKTGITPKKFIEKHARYIEGGVRFLDKWFKGESREKGEQPGAAAFRISRGYYDEEAMVTALKQADVYSEIRGAERRR